MMHKVTIAIDSFKGSLTSTEAAAALAEGIRSSAPTACVEQIPLADGGEGSADVLAEALGGTRVEVAVSDPLGRPIVAHYAVVEGGVALVDVASAAGLALLKPSERNPMATSSRGVGQLIRHALERGARRVVLCLGGSATVDCGLGLLAELGLEFRNEAGSVVEPCGASLGQVVTIVRSERTQHLLEGIDLLLAVDVLTPLVGPTGAAQMFAPQKGATSDQVLLLESGATHFAEVVLEATGRNMLSVEGAGAAGGMGGALWALLGATICSGAEYIVEQCGFDTRALGSRLVITGEGCVDNQTLLGKLPSVVLRRALALGLPTVAVGGSVRWCEALRQAPFKDIVAATPEAMSLDEALRRDVAQENLRRVGRELAREWLL